MKIVNSNLIEGQSLADKIWNDAMETAALYCDDEAHTLCAANGKSETWVWPASNFIRRISKALREQKRETDPIWKTSTSP